MKIDALQGKQLQCVSFSFDALQLEHQQHFPGGPIVVCPPLFPPEGVSSEQWKLSKEEP
jgi:hypothetical protein